GSPAGKRCTSACGASSECFLWEASADRAVPGLFARSVSARKADGSHLGRLTGGFGLAFVQQSAQRCSAQWALYSPGSTRSCHRGDPVGLATSTVVYARSAETTRSHASSS